MLSGVSIVDGGDADYASTNWYTYGGGHGGTYQYDAAGNGSGVASWTFDVVPGVYQVATTWVQHPNRATDAPYTISNGSVALGTVDINQEVAPNDFTDSGTNWETLGEFLITDTQMTVQLTDDANEWVVADAVRIQRIVGIAVTETGSTIVSESGTTDSFDVALTAQPASNVVLNIASSDTSEVAVASNTLTFTSANWNVPQAVTVTGVADTVNDGDTTSAVTVSVNVGASDSEFSATPSQTVAVTNTNLIASGPVEYDVLVDNSGGVIVSEDGGYDTLSIGLTKVPTSPVYLNVSVSDGTEASASVTTLTLDSQNWQAQEVVLTGVDDSIVDGNHLSYVTISVAPSSDANFTQAGDHVIPLLNIDDDGLSQKVTVGSTTQYQSSGLWSGNTAIQWAHIGWGTSTGKWEVPVDNGRYRVSASWSPYSNRATDTPYTLFNGTNELATVDVNQRYSPGDFYEDGRWWTTLGNVDVTGGELGVLITNDISEGYALSEAIYIERLQETPSLVIEESDNSTFAIEGATDSFAVSLGSIPTQDVVIDVSSLSSAINFSNATLTFTAANWNIPQNVTVSTSAMPTGSSALHSAIELSIDATNSAVDYQVLPDRIIDFYTLPDNQAVIGDFDGDGVDDVARAGGGSVEISLNKGDQLVVESWTINDLNTGLAADADTVLMTNGPLYVGDFNGDGTDDLLSHNLITDTWQLATGARGEFLLTSSDVHAGLNLSEFTGTPAIGDFNADGRDDLAYRSSVTGEWLIQKSNGFGFDAAIWESDSPVAADFVAVDDFNADGRDDILLRRIETGELFVSTSLGNAFQTSQWGTALAGESAARVLTDDIDSDGDADVLFFNAADEWSVWTSTGQSLAAGQFNVPSVFWQDAVLVDVTDDGRPDLVEKGWGNVWRVGRATEAGFVEEIWNPVAGSEWFQPLSAGGVSVVDYDFRRRRAVDALDDVRNSIDFTPSYGALKGAEATESTGVGNAWDQASLLEDQLDGVVDSRFRSGRLSVTTDDLGQLNNWLGTFSVIASVEVLEQARLNPITTTDPQTGNITAVELDHAWLEVQVPTPNGLTWIDFDPSWKQYATVGQGSAAVEPSLDLSEFLTSTDTSTVTMDFESMPLLDPSVMILQGGGVPYLLHARTTYMSRVETELVSNEPAVNGTVSGIFEFQSSWNLIGRRTETSELGLRLLNANVAEIYLREGETDTVLATGPANSLWQYWIPASLTIEGETVTANINGSTFSHQLGSSSSINGGFFGVLLEGTEGIPAFVDDLQITTEKPESADVIESLRAAAAFAGPIEGRTILQSALTESGLTRTVTRAATTPWSPAETTSVTIRLRDGSLTTSIATSVDVSLLSADSLNFSTETSTALELHIPGSGGTVTSTHTVNWSTPVVLELEFTDPSSPGSGVSVRTQSFALQQDTIGVISVDVSQHTMGDSFDSLDDVDTQFQALAYDADVPEALAFDLLAYLGQTYFVEAAERVRQLGLVNGTVALHPVAGAGMVTVKAGLALSDDEDERPEFYVELPELQMDQPGPPLVPVSRGYFSGSAGPVREDHLITQALLLSAAEAEITANATGVYTNSMLTAFGIATVNGDDYFQLSKSGSSYIDSLTGTSFTLSQLQAALQHSTVVETEIVSLLDANQTVLVTENEVHVNEWHGTPFLTLSTTADVPFAQSVLMSANGLIRHGAIAGDTEVISAASTTDSALRADAYSGIVRRVDTDLTLAADGLPFSLSRTWRATSLADSGFGQGWNNVFNETLINRVSISDLPGPGYLWISADGGVYNFQYEVTTNSWTTPPTLPGAELVSINTWVKELRLKDGSVRRFQSFDGSTSLKITETRDRHGNILRFDQTREAYAYAPRQVTAIYSSGPDAAERQILTIDWDGTHVSSISDFTGRQWSYNYESSAGLTRLVSVDGPMLPGQTPDESTRSFTYTYTDVKAYEEDEDENGGEEVVDQALLTSATSATEGTIQYSYFQNRRLKSSTTPDGGIVRVRYDQTTGQTTILDTADRPTVYQYAEDGSLMKTVYADGQVTQNTWDHSRAQLLTTESTGRGLYSFTYDADGNGNLLTSVDPTGLQTTYTYEPSFHQAETASQDPTPAQPSSGDERTVITNVYSTTIAGAQGNPLSTTNALGETTSYTYTPGGKVSTVTTARGNAAGANAAEFTTTFGYDMSNGAVTSTQLPGTLGNQPSTSSTVDALGRVVTSTDETGLTTHYNYDIHGRLTETYMVDGITAAERGRETLTYTNSHQLQTRTSPDGTVFRYEYDAANRPIREIAPDGSFTEMSYNTDGTLAQSTDAAGNTISYVYDLRGRQTQVIYSDGSVMATIYDSAGSIGASIDQNGHHTTFAFDEFGRPIATVDGLGNSTSTTYDEFSNVQTVTDARGVSTSLTYDALDRVVRSQVGDTRIDVQQYDENGNTTVSSSYDIVGLLPAQIPQDLSTLSATRTHSSAVAYDQRDRAFQWTDSLQQVRSITMDAASRITSETNVQGHVTNFEFDGLGRLTRTLQPAATTGAVRPQTDQLVDDQGRILQSIDAEGNVTQFFYDAFGRQTQSVDAAGNTASIEYDVLGRATQTIDELGRTTGMQFDSLNRQIGTSLPAVETATGTAIPVNTLSYDNVGNVVSTTDVLGRTSTVAYNALNQAIVHTSADPDGDGPLLPSITTSTYDAHGNVISVTDARSNTTQFAYDQLGRHSLVTLPLLPGQTQPTTASTTYDAFGNITETTDANGNTTQHQYDALNRRTKTIFADPDGPTGSLTETQENVAYDEQGNVRFVTDALGRITEYQYDNHGRLVLQILPDPDLINGVNGPLPQPTTSYTYDLVGNQLTMTDAAGRTTTSTFDELNRQSTVTLPTVDYLGSPVSVTTSVSYDAVGNVLTQTDAAGRVTSFAYDGMNRPVQTTLPAPESGQAAPVLNTAYDLAGNRISSTDALGNTTSFEYDNLNRLVRTVFADPDGSGSLLSPEMSQAYDAVGNVVLTIDPLGSETATIYDEWNRATITLAPEVDYQGQTIRPTTVTEYDSVGNVVAMTDPRGYRTEYVFDALNRQTNTIQPDPDGSGSLTAATTTTEYDAIGNVVAVIDARLSRTEFAYDNLNRKIQTTYADPDGTGALASPVTTQTYNVAGNIATSTDPLNRVTSYAYDNWDRLISTTLPDPDNFGAGNNGPLTAPVVLAAYDLSGNTITSTDPLGNVTHFGFDNLNRQTSVILADPDGTGPLTAATTVNTFDLAGNLLQVNDQGRTTSFTYDALNRQTTTTLPDPDGTDPLQALTSPILTTGYDAAGNVISAIDPLGRTTTFAYDSHNRQTDVYLPHPDASSSAPGPHTQTTYNQNGNIEKTIDALGRETDYTYDGWNQPQTVLLPAVAGLPRISTTTAYDAVGNRVSSTDHLNRQTTWTWDFLNRQTTQTLPDADLTDSIAAPVTTTTYDAMGNVLTITDALQRITAFEYDQLDRQIKTTLPDQDLSDVLPAPFTETTYDAAGNVTSHTDVRGFTTAFDYDDWHRQIKTTLPPVNGQTIRQLTSYDQFGNVTSQTDAEDRVTEFQYDNLNRQIATILPAVLLDGVLTNPISTTQYDAANNAIRSIDAEGLITATTYDQLNRPIEVSLNRMVGVTTYSPGTETVIASSSMEYDFAGNVRFTTDALQRTAEVQYDALNRKTAEILPNPTGGSTAGPTTQFVYDAAGNLESTIDPLGNATSYLYDRLDRQVRQTLPDPDGAGNPLPAPYTITTYDNAGNVTQTSDHLNRVTVLEYDRLNNLIKQTLPDPDGLATEYASPVLEFHYDAAGNLLESTDPKLNKTTFTYDELGRQKSQTQPAPDGTSTAATTQFEYDRVGNLISTTDPLQRITTVQYDALNRPILTTQPDPDGVGTNNPLPAPTIANSYDLVGNLLVSTDHLGRSSSFQYDDLYRQTSVTLPDPDGNGPLSAPVSTQTFDLIGNLQTQTDALGRTTTYGYDDLNRQTSLTLPDPDGSGPLLAAVATTTYDANGNITAQNDQGRITNYTYDALNRQTSETLPDPDGVGPLLRPVSTQTYDAAGNVASTTDALQRTITFAYDALDRQTDVWLPHADINSSQLGPRSQTKYDQNGNVVQTIDALNRVTDYEYDAWNRQTKELLPQVPNLPRISTTTVYDAVGNVVAQEDHLGRRTEWDYDSLNRQTSATLPDADLTDSLAAPVNTTTYDAAGNILSATDALQRVTTYEYDNLDRLIKTTLPDAVAYDGIAAPWTASTYDAVGNVLTSTDVRGFNTTYTYDALDRQTYESLPIVNGSIPVTTIAYDQFGNMDTQTDPEGNVTAFEYDTLDRQTVITHPAVMFNGVLTNPTTAFFYDAVGNLVQQRDANGITTRSIFDGQHRISGGQRVQGAIEPGEMGPENILSITSQTYNLVGNVTTRTDAAGRTTSWNYDELNRQTQEILPHPDGLAAPGPTTNYVYDNAGNLYSQQDALGNLTVYLYDRLDRQVRETLPDPDGGNALPAPITYTTYDNAGNAVSSSNHLGRTTSFEYDGLDRMFRQTSPDPDGIGPLNAVVQTTTFDAAGNVLTTTDGNGKVTSNTYDALGRHTSQTLPSTSSSVPAAIDLFEYDLIGNLTQSTDALGRITSYDYDALNRQTLQTLPDPDGTGSLIAPHFASTYDLVGNLLSSTDQLGRTTTYGYNSLYQQTSETLPDPDGIGPLSAPVTGYTYDTVGNRTSMTDANGNVTTWVYDDLDRRTLVRQANPVDGSAIGGPEINYLYDAAGNLLQQTDPKGRVTTFTYDDLQRQITETGPDPDGAGVLLASLTTTVYDAAGNVQQSTVRLDGTTNQTTQYAYDALDRQTKVTDDRGGETSYAYDANGNRLSLTDAEGNVTAWQYDARNRVTREIDPLSKHTTFEYDLVSNRTAVVDRRGLRTEFTYDDLDRLTLESFFDGSTAAGKISWQYNDARLLQQAHEQNAANATVSKYTYTYDNLDRMIELSTAGTPGLGNTKFDYEYDAASNLTSRIHTFADNITTTSRQYDGMNRVKSTSQIGTHISDKHVVLDYDTDSRLNTVSRYSDLTATNLVVQTDFDRDLAGQMTDLTHSDGVTDLAGYEYTYNAAGWITSTTSLLDQDSDYTYDNTGQLVDASHDAQTDENYAYDLAGNRIGSQYIVGAGNRVERDGTYAYEYDEEGNRTKRTELVNGQPTGNSVEYAWDHRNRLTSVTHKNSAGVVQKTVSYTYDVNGMRISRTVVEGSTTSTTRYVYDGDQLVTEVGQTGIDHQYFDGPGIDEIFADENALGEVLSPLADHQGTVRDLAGVDSITGFTELLNHRTLDSFGNIVAETDNTVDHNFAFAGRHFDADAGLYYNRARWFDPESGTFLGEDPLGFDAGDANITRYTANNPVNYIDPTGLSWLSKALDSVGDFFEDVGDFFEDVGDFIGEQWDNGNIQKVLLGAATIVTAGAFAPVAAASFGALTAGGGLAAAGTFAYSTVVLASAGVNAYQVYSGDQIGDGTLSRVLGAASAVGGGIYNVFAATSNAAAHGVTLTTTERFFNTISLADAAVSGYELLTGDTIGDGTLGSILNVSSLGINRGRSLVDPKTTQWQRVDDTLRIVAGAASLVNTGDKGLQDALRTLSIVSGISSTAVSIRQAYSTLQPPVPQVTRQVQRPQQQTQQSAPATGSGNYAGYSEFGVLQTSGASQGSSHGSVYNAVYTQDSESRSNFYASMLQPADGDNLQSVPYDWDAAPDHTYLGSGFEPFPLEGVADTSEVSWGDMPRYTRGTYSTLDGALIDGATGTELLPSFGSYLNYKLTPPEAIFADANNHQRDMQRYVDNEVTRLTATLDVAENLILAQREAYAKDHSQGFWSAFIYGTENSQLDNAEYFYTEAHNLKAQTQEDLASLTQWHYGAPLEYSGNGKAYYQQKYREHKEAALAGRLGVNRDAGNFIDSLVNGGASFTQGYGDAWSFGMTTQWSAELHGAGLAAMNRDSYMYSGGNVLGTATFAYVGGRVLAPVAGPMASYAYGFAPAITTTLGVTALGYSLGSDYYETYNQWDTLTGPERATALANPVASFAGAYYGFKSYGGDFTAYQTTGTSHRAAVNRLFMADGSRNGILNFSLGPYEQSPTFSKPLDNSGFDPMLGMAQRTVGANTVISDKLLPVLNAEFTPRTVQVLQNVTDFAVLELEANPQIARELMTPGSYAHLVNETNLAPASYGKAVERLSAEIIARDANLNRVFQYQARPFVSTPDFHGYEGMNLHLLDITTERAIPAHMSRTYGPTTDYIIHPGLPTGMQF